MREVQILRYDIDWHNGGIRREAEGDVVYYIHHEYMINRLQAEIIRLKSLLEFELDDGK